MSQEWLETPAAELGRGIEAGRIDPVDLTETFLAAIEAHPLSPRIYACPTPERARAEAEAARARARSGLRRGLLDGVPVSWKDLFDTAGIATEAGSALLAGRVPERDARVVRNATFAGTVCLGKTHLSELAFSGLGLNPVTETPPARHDGEAVAGGSSSGAAASVAQGLAPLAIGSDTGGSVRIPAAWNDLVGLKTSHGRLSLEGVVPLCPRFDTVGPLARTVEDAALALAALEGGRPADLAGASLAGARLMVLETVALDDLRPEPAAGFENAVARLEAAGARIERRALPFVAEAHALSPVLFAAEAYATWEREIEAAPEKMFPQILARFRGGRDVLARDYIRAWAKLETFRARWQEETAGFDAVILPTAPNLPPKIDRLMSDDEYYRTENLLTLRNTRIGNLMGLAALTLPTGVPATGIMLMIPPGSEERLLRLGSAAEAALA
ncbi:aspartyl-tRNA(Asn)/glutamyl-tRNA(Gln) amidotransferase subunit A [Meinhardsimonia xiamenensis]|jgi:aspartyl-tRNA(Asn)/glutamyl-tRNA(Gln) amidotransferase subunit A|uniref:Aspartyl-tRNA(Asn)/glutamyl-tRNA(Gln) amidotransferase subunit A n=1 Tax=Meinhardsimonia xiamenensis TaxID=990712 RepID=A0A1G8YNQ8_9RHOB|nr:amidase family protein [Meinhardsimonia xiamenensis]PRX37351.1 aspartyl-tRNA(Asn)/glutamyl-tRNA(Gln) amidotransferase subunit A [Meinhardsimonia xiamenensis]SDK03745.1 aspartyl-tRNA(Asn)/glutamyl-tRNA(Gln) amidotransferase subunit A [Meinhardsimonia xiamenensis]